MLRCIAIDDEPLALELLEDNISKVPYLQLAASCSNAMEAIRVLQQTTVDLIFLDIQMPGLTGLQFIQSLSSRPMIILITAYEKYALEGFNLDVVDYLVKPVPVERFVKACNKAWELHSSKVKPVEVITDKSVEYLFVNVNYSLLKVVIDDIIWVEGLKDYIKIHLKSTAKPVVTRMTMKSVEESLPAARFIRIHKSYIVAINFITAVKKSAVLIGPQELPVSDTYQEVLIKITGRQG
jgi:two-component system, LytTR family, response regulator